MMSKPRVKVPKTSIRGEVIEIKTLVNHVMESGFRKDRQGNLYPRSIVNHFACEFNGEPVFSADLGTGIASNPYLKFHVRVNESGTFKFVWTDDDGASIDAMQYIEVT